MGFKSQNTTFILDYLKENESIAKTLKPYTCKKKSLYLLHGNKKAKRGWPRNGKYSKTHGNA